MKNLAVSIALTATALFAISCGGQEAGNNANKPSNTANAANANIAGNTAAAEAEVRKIIDTTQAALSKNDAEAMDKIYADNYMTVNIDGSVQTRAERMASLRSGDTKYDSFAFSDTNIRVNPEGNGAVAITVLAMKGNVQGQAVRWAVSRHGHLQQNEGRLETSWFTINQDRRRSHRK
jgi:hypothetical protein